MKSGQTCLDQFFDMLKWCLTNSSLWLLMKLKWVPGRPFMKYNSENKSRACVIWEKVVTQSVLYLCKMIITKSHTVWRTVNADHMTSVNFTDWSLNCWKSLPLLVSQVADKEESCNFHQRNFLTKRDYWWCHHLG